MLSKEKHFDKFWKEIIAFEEIKAYQTKPPLVFGSLRHGKPLRLCIWAIKRLLANE
jgi:hypothetical protein